MCKPQLPSPCWPSQDLFLSFNLVPLPPLPLLEPQRCFEREGPSRSGHWAPPEPAAFPLKEGSTAGGVEPASQSCSHTSLPALPWQRSGAPRRQQLSPCLCMTHPMSQRRKGLPQRVRGPPGPGSPACQRMTRGPLRSMTNPGSGRRSGFPKPLPVSPGWRGQACWGL